MKHVLSFCESTLVNDVIFSVIALFFVIYFFIRRGTIIASNTVLILGCSSALYLYYRISGEVWEFVPFQTLPIFKYFDILLLAAGLALTAAVTSLFKKSNMKKSAVIPFDDDEPVGKDKPDELGYSTYAKTVAAKIEATRLERSFAIGINGRWGIGKTSFLNLVRRELNRQESIIVEFNPWGSNSPQAIVQDFFDALQEALRPYYASLAHQLGSYSGKLVSVSDSGISRFVNSTLSIITEDGSLNSLYSQINDRLKRVDRRIVIFIDDLDRLDKHEIMEVMRLIRNTASFYNTFFVVAYDRDYVLRATSDHNPQNHELFLEKIFQLEVNLPYFDKRIFREKLAANIKLLLHDEDHRDEVDGTFFNTPFRGGVDFDEWLTTMRDVTRLMNSLSLTLHNLQGEVLLREFLYLELLRLKFPSAYEEFSRNPRKYLELKEFRQFKYKYELKDGDDCLFMCFLKNNKERLSLPESAPQRILDLLRIVFPENAFHYRSVEDLSVVFPSNFTTYFTYHITGNKLSAVEFAKARRLPQQAFQGALKKWVEQGLEREVAEKLDNVHDYNDREDFENIIHGIFFLTTLKSLLPDRGSRNVYYYPKGLVDKLYNGDGRLTKNYYKDPVDFQHFISSLLRQASLPYMFEAELVREWLNGYDENPPVPIEELKVINVWYFRNYCNSIDRLERTDNHFWTLFHCCTFNRWIPQSNSYKSEKAHIVEAVEVVKAFVATKDPEGFLLELISVEMREENTFVISHVVVDIWGSWEDFGQYLLDLQDKWQSNYICEFIRFFNEFITNEPKVYIPFEFKCIPVRKKS